MTTIPKIALRLIACELALWILLYAMCLPFAGSFHPYYWSDTLKGFFAFSMIAGSFGVLISNVEIRL